tara:strand:+ start:14544 stop:15794 length:1251 start_codon:yes stop_codon:yes gene_type:complete
LEDWEILRIKGIPLRLHSSWFVILFLFTWTAKEQISNLSEVVIPTWLSWGIGFITSVLLFLSVLLHELGHSFMAIHEGVKVRSITLFFLGGVAKVDRECHTAMGSLRVAIAGPLVSFCLAIIFFISIKLFSIENQILENLLFQLGSLNLVLGLFNLLPGLPLDGGIILKSLVWHFTGSQRKGNKVATSTGRFLSLAAIFIGSFICISAGGLNGLWLILIGWFGFGFSRSQNQMFLIQDVLCDLKVLNASRRDYRIFEKKSPLNTLSDIRLSSDNNESSSKWILICDEGRWVGYLTTKVLKDVPVQNWSQYCIGDYAQPLKDLPSISEKLDLWQAVLEVEKSQEGRLLVLSSAGLPIGTLDRADIGIAIFKKMGIDIPNHFIDLARKQNTYPLSLELPKIVEGIIASGITEKFNKID